MRTSFFLSLPCGLLLFCLCLSTSLQAQQTKDSLRTRWEAGADLLSLFEKNNVPAASLFFRRNYTNAAGRHRALRFRVGMDVSEFTYQGIGNFPPETRNAIFPYIGIGHEWQTAGKHYRWFYGADLSGQYGRESYFVILDTDPTVEENGRTNILRLNLGGFIGFQYDLTPRLAVSLESAYTVQHFRSHLTAESGIRGLPPSGFSDTTITEFNSAFRPFHVVHLIFKLDKYTKHAKRKT